MSKTKVYPFEVSERLLKSWLNENYDDHVCNWQIEDKDYHRFRLECYTLYRKGGGHLGMIIVQVWSDGNGFTVYWSDGFMKDSDEFKRLEGVS